MSGPKPTQEQIDEALRFFGNFRSTEGHGDTLAAAYRAAVDELAEANRRWNEESALYIEQRNRADKVEADLAAEKKMFDESFKWVVEVCVALGFGNQVATSKVIPAIAALKAGQGKERAKALLEAAKDVKCLASQLPGNGACAFEDDEDDGPCELCMAARLEGKARAAEAGGESA